MIGGYVNGLKVVNQACVGWRNSKYSIGMNRKSFGLFTFTVFCSINVIDHICYRSIIEQEIKMMMGNAERAKADNYRITINQYLQVIQNLRKFPKKIGWMYKNRQQLKTSKVRDRQNGNGRKCVLEKLEKKMS